MSETGSKPKKPLGHRAYGSIPHLIGSNRGPSDKGANEGQHRICTEKCRKGDAIIVTEKLDGSNVSVARIDGEIVPLIRAGYRAIDSRFNQHGRFNDWVQDNEDVFRFFLDEGERVCGEWLDQAHGTRYSLIGKSPFVVFDIMQGHSRSPFQEVIERVGEMDDLMSPRKFIQAVPLLAYESSAIPIDKALNALGEHGKYGAIDKAEGVVYRVERDGKFDFMAKFVRSDFIPGKYLNTEIWNQRA